MTYTLFSLPYIPEGLNFRSLTASQARENFEVFVGRVRERVRALTEMVRMEMPTWHPDLSDDSLVPLGEWYASHVEERAPTPEEVARESRQCEPVDDLSSIVVQYTPMTLSIGADIGTYIGECVRVRCPATAWKLNQQSKQPVVAGTGLKEAYHPIPKAQQLALTVSHQRMRSSLSERPIGEPRTLAEAHVATILSLPHKDPRSILQDALMRVLTPESQVPWP